ncbi:MAG: hypothetical protein AB7I27_17510 [Bacteriovoracaceae bacterium]
MENKNTISKTGTGTGTGTGEEESTEEVKNNENGKVQRIAVSKEAQGTLKAITDRVNDGFMGGKVNLVEMANWILLRFQNELDETKIKEIRAEHFDEVAMLESVLKQAKESGKVPSDFKVLLQKQLGLEEPAKRKAKGALT